MEYINHNTSTSTGTVTISMEFKKPIFSFTMPYFKFMKKPEPIYFYTLEEVQKFLKKLPKSWIISLITNKI